MKKLFFVFVCIASCLFSTAQTTDNKKTTDKKASEILNALTTKTKSYSNIKIDFAYVMENKTEKINESKKGTILVAGEKYRLDIAGQTVICDGKTTWTYIKDANEVQINSIEGNDDALTPNKLLTSYNEQYRSKLVREATENGVLVQVIDLFPKEGKSFFKVRLVIDKAKTQILSSTIFDKNGSTFAYQVNKFQTNLSIDASKFTFKEKDFPGVEVIDMR